MTKEQKTNKLKMHSPDLTEANIEKLAELFPNCVTEGKDENGNLKRAIDFDQLRHEPSDHVVDAPPGPADAPVGRLKRPRRGADEEGSPRSRTSVPPLLPGLMPRMG